MTEKRKVNGILGDYPLARYTQQPTGVTVNSLLVFAETTRADIAVNTLRSMAIWLPRVCTLDRIGVRVIAAGGAGANIRVGLYADSGSCHPTGAPLVDGGELDATGTGVLLATISYQIPYPGLYWLTMNSDDALIDLSCPNTANTIQLTSTIATGNSGWTVASNYGALPTWPGGEAANYIVPAPYYRILSYP